MPIKQIHITLKPGTVAELGRLRSPGQSWESFFKELLPAIRLAALEQARERARILSLPKDLLRGKEKGK